MWRVALQDLHWRRRRFVIAVLAASLVFGMTLLMTGFSTSLHNEGRRIVAALGADAWLVAEGAPGPFTTSTPIQAADAGRVARAPGVARADPLVILHSTVRRPAVRDVAGAGEAVADTELGLRLGDRLELGGRQLLVVGLADQVTWYFGTPTLFLALEDAQAVAFGGQPLAMAVLTKGTPGAAPPGLELLSNEQAIADLERPLVRGTQSIDLISALLWLVAAGIIGSIVYLSVLERLRELAEPGRIVVVATHDERLLPLADRIVQLSPAADGASRPPERFRFQPGQIVFEQGDRSELVYTIEEGEIEVVRQRADGGEELLALLGRGRYFGELGPLFGLQRSATARAVGQAVVTGHTPGDFRELVGSGRIAEAIRQASP